MTCKNLSKFYPIVMNFTGYLLLYEDKSAIDLGPHRSTSSAVLKQAESGTQGIKLR